MNYKIVSLTVLSAISLLTACSANDANSTEPILLSDQNLIQLSKSDSRDELYTLKDGLYFAEEQNFSEDGWKNTVTFEVKDGLITTVNFNAVNEHADENKRTLSQNGEYMLTDSENHTLSWHEQIEKLEAYILSNQNVSTIQTTDSGTTDAISGITISVQPFIDLINSAIVSGPIERGSYQDGHYYAEEATFTDGHKYTINLMIENGYIVAAHWDAVNEDGTMTSEQQTPETESWKIQAQLLEAYLISIQDPTLMTYNEENKTDAISGVTIEVNQFIELAILALASGPTID